MEDVSDIHRVKKEVNAACFKLCKTKDDADDLGQQIILKFLKNLQNIEHPEYLKKWMRSVIRNAFIDEHRRGRRETPFSHLKDNSILYNADGDDICVKNYVLGIDDESFRCYERLSKVLSPLEKKVIEETLVQGYQAKEVCEKLNISPNALAKTKVRAIKKMKNKVKLSDLPPSWLS